MEQWSRDAASVWTGMTDRRTAHPTATFSAIEAAPDERLSRVRARVLPDPGPTSTAAADLQVARAEERIALRGVWERAAGAYRRAERATGRC